MVTRGGEGAVAVRHDGTVLEVPGVPVAVADTVGAGDTFSGVLVDALLGARGARRRGGSALRALTDRDVLLAVTAAAVGRGDQRLATRRRPAVARRARRRARRGPAVGQE